jgi:DNA processing protein
MGLQPVARHFPCRNRIISGLSRATVIVEAAAKSGSLITARDALDQGRDVLAVPGNPFDARAAGCNQLIREGATLVRSAQDVIEALAPLHGDAPELPFAKDQPGPVEPANKKRKKALSEVAALHRQILSRLSPAPVAEDQLIRDLAVPASEAAPALLDLELDGRIRRQSGGMISRE